MPRYICLDKSKPEAKKMKKIKFNKRIKLILAVSLTGKCPISEDTLSDTYMMFPSVVNATKKPSRACKKREMEVIRCYSVLDSSKQFYYHISLSSVVVKCVTDKLLFTIYGAPIYLRITPLLLP